MPDQKSGEHNYLYTHFEKNKIPNATNRLLDSVYYVHQLGLTEQDLRFFDADGTNVASSNVSHTGSDYTVNVVYAKDAVKQAENANLHIIDLSDNNKFNQCSI